MKNQAQLITYIDRFGGGTIAALQAWLEGPLRGVFGGVHLLPFYDAIDGADAGFDPKDHTRVDPRLGGWADIGALAQGHEVMADVIVNHISVESPQFRDNAARGADSPYDGLFLRFDAVFPRGATEQDLHAIYRPRPGLPFTPVPVHGGKRLLWTTFTPQQLDIDVAHPQGRVYLDSILHTLAAQGVAAIRLDAVGYAIKRAGSSCFMLPETFAFIDTLAERARALGIEVLVEVHSHHLLQIEIAARVDWVYDFALPPLVLHAFYWRTALRLKHWLGVRPNNAVTVLDTHDGIGIIDIGADATNRAARPGLVPDDELQALVERIHDNSRGQSRQATGAAASNLDLYQVNCTFFDALARDTRAYLLARAIQCFVPGVPQIYYVGLLAGGNDMTLLAKSGVGRDINRHHYSAEEITQALATPVVQDLLALLRWRNTHAAFNGQFELLPSHDAVLHLRWSHGAARALLWVDLRDLSYELSFADEAGTTPLRFTA